MAGIVPRDLGPGELDDPGLRGLLRLATDYDETALTRLVVEELPALVVLAAWGAPGPPAQAPPPGAAPPGHTPARPAPPPAPGAGRRPDRRDPAAVSGRRRARFDG